MTTIICSTYEDMSLKAAEIAGESIKQNRETLISFPGGDTPLGMVREFVRRVNEGSIDISRTRYVSLDEWVGLGKNAKGSCAYFNFTNIIDELQKPFLDYHIINGKAMDMEEECNILDDYIKKFGPLDLSVLGIGLNGHLGFNEEGVDFSAYAHLTPLSETTKSVMGKYFDQEYPLKYGITQGIAHIMEAGKVVLIANGHHKAAIIKKAFYGPVTNEVPASILQKHPNCYLVIDTEAAEYIK